MNITMNELTGKNSEQLSNEIKFFIACAKSLKKDLIILNIKEGESVEKEIARINAVNRLLRTAKHQGLIQLFLTSTEINTQATEAEYLRNKYPELASYVSDVDPCYILKL